MAHIEHFGRMLGRARAGEIVAKSIFTALRLNPNLSPAIAAMAAKAKIRSITDVSLRAAAGVCLFGEGGVRL